MVLKKTFIFYFFAIKVLCPGNSIRGVGKADIFILLKIEVQDVNLNTLVICEIRLPEKTSKLNFVSFFFLRIEIILTDCLQISRLILNIFD